MSRDLVYGSSRTSCNYMYFIILSLKLKEIIRKKLGDDIKGEICLIFSGKILKDDDTLESHGMTCTTQNE